MLKHFFIILITLSWSSLFASTEDGLYKVLDEQIAKNQLSKALPTIEKGLKKDPKNIELYMRQARIITLQGDQSTKEEEKVSAYESAEKIATKMIEMDPKSAKGYLRRAIAKGKLILFKGILQSRSLVLDLRSDTKKVLSLSGVSAYEKALANYLLGRAHLKLAEKPKALRLPLGLAWASKSKGGDFLKQAYTLSPTSVSFNLDYAKWLKDNDKIAEAKKILNQIDSLAIYDPGDTERKKTAKKILKEI